jgi:hypothetical protein
LIALGWPSDEFLRNHQPPDVFFGALLTHPWAS